MAASDTMSPAPRAVGTGAIKRSSEASTASGSSAAATDMAAQTADSGKSETASLGGPVGKVPGCGTTEGVHLVRSLGKKFGGWVGLREKEAKAENVGKGKGKGKARAVEA